MIIDLGQAVGRATTGDGEVQRIAIGVGHRHGHRAGAVFVHSQVTIRRHRALIRGRRDGVLHGELERSLLGPAVAIVGRDGDRVDPIRAVRRRALQEVPGDRQPVRADDRVGQGIPVDVGEHVGQSDLDQLAFAEALVRDRVLHGRGVVHRIDGDRDNALVFAAVTVLGLVGEAGFAVEVGIRRIGDHPVGIDRSGAAGRSAADRVAQRITVSVAGLGLVGLRPGVLIQCQRAIECDRIDVDRLIVDHVHRRRGQRRDPSLSRIGIVGIPLQRRRIEGTDRVQRIVPFVDRLHDADRRSCVGGDVVLFELRIENDQLAELVLVMGATAGAGVALLALDVDHRVQVTVAIDVYMADALDLVGVTDDLDLVALIRVVVQDDVGADRVHPVVVQLVVLARDPHPVDDTAVRVRVLDDELFLGVDQHFHPEGIGAGAAFQNVIRQDLLIVIEPHGRRIDRVVRVVAVLEVGRRLARIRAGEQHVVAGAALQEVLAPTAVQRVVAFAAHQLVIAVAAVDHVVAAGPVDGVVTHQHGAFRQRRGQVRTI